MANKKRSSVDLTQGNITKQLLRYTIPLILTGVLQLLYTLFDSLIVGNLIGSEALAAVNSAVPVMNIFLFVVNGLVTGCTIQVSYLTGAGRKHEIMGLTAVSGGVLAGISVAIAGICLLSVDSLLQLLKTPGEIFLMSQTYFAVIAYGIPFLALYNLTSSVARGLGDSKGPFYVLMTTSLLNIVLDFLFVGVWKQGIGGAAFATVLSQIASAVLMSILLLRQLQGDAFQNRQGGRLRLVTKHTMPLFLECIRLAIPTTIRSVILALGSLCITNVRNMLGPAVVEGISGAYNIDGFLMMPFLYVGNASSVFTGTNLAAGKYERIRTGIRQMFLCLMAYQVPMLLLILFGARYLLMGFGLDEEAVGIGYRFLLTAASFYPLHGIQTILSGYLEGRKRVTASAVVNVSVLGVRVVLGYLLMKPLGADVVAWAEIISWMYGAAVLCVMYKMDRKEITPQQGE